MDFDIAVIGAGFSGSLISLLLKQIGLRAILIDRGTHPRFAIGESSTPIANLILDDLGRRYDLPQISSLSNYGSWKRVHPGIVCGLKRGFSYFHHEQDQPFQPRHDHANELLVAASAGMEDAETHWLRSDFDQYLANEAAGAGIPYFDQTTIEDARPKGSGWELQARRLGETYRWTAALIIDASGDGGFVSRHLGIGSHTAGQQTRSRSLFSHFRGVKRWHDLYTAWGGNAMDHPYPCDDAALHHVFDGGWMWVLPFDNGVTSAGFSLDPDQFPLDRSIPPEAEWASIMKRFPSVAEQFADAQPTVLWRQTGRIQRRLHCSAGSNWVMLPNTATFLDPFYSTGNAFTLNGIDRLMDLLERSWRRPDWTDAMKQYDARIQQESEFLDLLVGSTFAGFRDFPRMAAVSMFYFAAATWSESERRAGRVPRGAAFLAADQPELVAGLMQAAAEVRDPAVSTADFVSHVRSAIAPFNRVGLCDDARQGMYPFITE